MRVVIINGDSMGRGDAELGHKLTGSFLRRLWAGERSRTPSFFFNSGVKLLARDSAMLDALEGLASAGVDLLACGTCISFFNLREPCQGFNFRFSVSEQV